MLPAYTSTVGTAAPVAHGIVPALSGEPLIGCKIATPEKLLLSQIPLGRTIMKRQLLKAAGWTVMSIPGHEWCRVSHSWKLRKQYMQCLLRMHAYGDA